MELSSHFSQQSWTALKKNKRNNTEAICVPLLSQRIQLGVASSMQCSFISRVCSATVISGYSPREPEAAVVTGTESCSAFISCWTSPKSPNQDLTRCTAECWDPSLGSDPSTHCPLHLNPPYLSPAHSDTTRRKGGTYSTSERWGQLWRMDTISFACCKDRLRSPKLWTERVKEW